MNQRQKLQAAMREYFGLPDTDESEVITSKFVDSLDEWWDKALTNTVQKHPEARRIVIDELRRRAGKRPLPR